MTTLIINDLMADLKTGSSFKFTKSNSIYTEDGEYTLDVTLPFTQNNMAIFGLQNRLEINKKQLIDSSYNFRMQSDYLFVSGTAVISSVSDEEIKIQLIAGKSEMKLLFEDQEGNPIYIDDIPLPKAYEAEFRKLYGYGQEYTMEKAIDMMMRQPDMFFNPQDTMYGPPEKTNCVCFPIYSEADSAFANQRCMAVYETRSDDNKTFFKWYIWTLSDAPQSYPSSAAEYTVPLELVLSPQPYLFYIIEELFEALGYSVVENFIRDSWMKNIFIANARGILDLNMILPHWSLEEFIQEIENLCGVKILLKNKNQIYIVDKNKASGQPFIYLNQIVDSFQADIEDKEDTDQVSIGNVNYSYPDDLEYLVLSSEIFERAKKSSFDSYDQLYEYYQSLSLEELKKSDTLYQVGTDYFASINPGEAGWNLYEVNQMSQMQHQSYRDTDVNLRIVPIRSSYMDMEFKHFLNNNSTSDKYNFITKDTAKAIILVTSDTRSQNNYLAFSIDDAIKGTEVDRNKRDVIEVGINLSAKQNLSPTGALQGNYQIPIVWGIPLALGPLGRYESIDTRKHFQLKQNGTETIAFRLNSGQHAKTRTKLCISFLDEGIIDPEAYFIINNKKYVCEKIEYSISEKGVDKIKKGYFFEAES